MIPRAPIAAWVGVALALLGAHPALPALAQQPVDSATPAGASARCRDGTYSFSRHRSGMCSHHGGVATWLQVGAVPQGLRDTAAPARAVSGLPSAGAPGCGVHCGTERWAVKTLSDSDRARVEMQPVPTTIETLVALARPLAHPAFRRVAPVEITVYQVQARITWLTTEADSDYHVVLASPEDTTITMIAEVPDPQCAGACASGLASTYAELRQTLVDHLNSPHSVARPLVRVTGVGFFDFYHRQRGAARNAIELHPVLKIEFP
jgi:uncharacterized protein DUF3761